MSPAAKIRVLIVEDSPVARELLAHILRSDARLEIAGFAWDGEEALNAVETLRPDVVTMDIHMPKLDGFATTRRIMERTPLPILIVTSSAQSRRCPPGVRCHRCRRGRPAGKTSRRRPSRP